MKIKLLVKLGEWILGKGISEEEPRADLYLPIWLLAFALVLLAVGVSMELYLFLHFSVGASAVAVICLVLGIAALLCWKNQTVQMLSEETFEYSTFLGNKTVYRFDEIRGIKKNSDSLTLYVGEGKVHIESCAIISDRFTERIAKELEALRESRRA